MNKSHIVASSIIKGLRFRMKRIGSPLLYAALLMYYAFRRNETPQWAKRIVLGGFVYLLAPIDAVPDLAPIIGYTDDMSVMFYALVLVSAYIDQDVRLSALQKLRSWLGQIDENELKKVNELL